jgi:adiponectin receptor
MRQEEGGRLRNTCENGHRFPSTTSQCLSSVFAVHTETGSIWTHGLGTVIFLATAVWLEQTRTNLEWTIYYSFVLATTFSFVASTLMHTFYNHQDECVVRALCELDYFGIALAITGHFVAEVHFLYYPTNSFNLMLYGSINTAIALVVVPLSFWDTFSDPGSTFMRAITYLVFGFFNFSPLVHFLLINSVFDAVQQNAIRFFMGEAVVQFIALLFYVTRVPERFNAKRFNVCANSHQIFHLLTVAGSVLFLFGICADDGRAGIVDSGSLR